MVATAGGLVLVPAAHESGTPNGLFAYVVATNHGPLHACPQSGVGCGPANTVTNVIYVANLNRLVQPASGEGLSRTTLPNSYVVSSVDLAIYVNGVHDPAFDGTETPPPNASFAAWSGHWPATVTCEGQPPCTTVGNPAILPGETTVALYGGWAHGDAEPDGSYVFKWTVHGTLNGTPVDLTASSQPIQMIR